MPECLFRHFAADYSNCRAWIGAKPSVTAYSISVPVRCIKLCSYLAVEVFQHERNNLLVVMCKFL